MPTSFNFEENLKQVETQLNQWEKEETDRPSTRSFRKKYRTALRLSFFFLISFLVIGGCLFWVSAKETHAYETAVQYYRENDLYEFETYRYQLSDKTKEQFEDFLIKQATNIVNQFEHKEISYQEARHQLTRIYSFSNNAEEIVSLQTFINQLHESREAFKEANQFAQEKQWTEAKFAYQKVIPEDENYSEAQQALENVSRWEIEEVLFQAITQYESSQYQESLKTIEKGLALSPENKTFLDLRNDVNQAIREGEKKEKWSTFKETLSESIESSYQNLKENIGSGVKGIAQWIGSWFQ